MNNCENETIWLIWKLMKMRVGGKQEVYTFGRVQKATSYWGEGKKKNVFSAPLHPPPQQQQGDAMCEEAGDSHFLKLKGC